jgi:hypothetical protein
MHAESPAVPPKIKSATPSFGIFTVAVSGFAAAGAGAVVFFFNPSTHGFYPICLFHQMTGLNCPGCGMTRALYALLHGHFQAALKDNALFLAVLAGLAVRGAWFTGKKISSRPAGQFLSANILWPVLIVAVIFTVLRNLPAFEFLSP